MYANSYTLKTIGGLIANTYILAIILAVIFISISLLVANLIAFEGGKNPQDPKKRRLWFFILAGINPTIFFLWNFIFISQKIKGAPAQDKFLIQLAIATGVNLLLYLIIGFVLSKISKKSKYGTIFS